MGQAPGKKVKQDVLKTTRGWLFSNFDTGFESQGKRADPITMFVRCCRGTKIGKEIMPDEFPMEIPSTVFFFSVNTIQWNCKISSGQSQKLSNMYTGSGKARFYITGKGRAGPFHKDAKKPADEKLCFSCPSIVNIKWWIESDSDHCI